MKRGAGEFEKVSVAPNDKEGYTTITLGGYRSSRGGDTPLRETKRRKLAADEQFEDLPMDTVAQIIATIDDPDYMTGPDLVCILFFIIIFFMNLLYFV